MDSYTDKNPVTIFTIVRDFIINILPIKQLPPYLSKRLFLSNPDIIFLTHPRNMDDIYNIAPFLKFLKKILPEPLICKIINLCPAYTVAKINWKEKIYGLVVTTSVLPSELFKSREKVIQIAEKIINYIRKISSGTVYVGLAAWWPIVTNNGLAFRRFLNSKDRIKVTNGHTATLASIYLTIIKILLISGLEIKKLNILIVGVGRMGAAVAKVLNGKVSKIGLGDQNAIRLEFVRNDLAKKSPSSLIENHIISETISDGELNLILSKYDIVICTTSNVSYIIHNKKALRNCIIIDDSRPEAFPRTVDFNLHTAVLEGGLIKINGVEINYDFGFGKRNNVFGCLAEAFILALDKSYKLKPILGEIDFDNFEKLLKFCEENNITAGDIMSGHRKLSDFEIKKLFSKLYESSII